MNLQEYRALDNETLLEQKTFFEESETYWLQQKNNYNDSYNQNRCIDEAIKCQTQLKRINIVLKNKKKKNLKKGERGLI
jgi:hypothetical protein